MRCARFHVATLIYLGLFLVGGESLPESDALVGWQSGQLIQRAVHLSNTLVLRVAVVVQQDDLERPTRQLRRRHVEDELLLELRAQSAPVNATLQLSAPVRQQTETTERVGRAAELTRQQISSLRTSDATTNHRRPQQ